MNTRRRSSVRAIAWSVLASVLIFAVGTAEAILRHPAGQAAALVLLPIGAYALGRWHGRRRAAPRHLDQRAAHERAADELARLRAAVADLEDAAGRPVAAIAASYRRIQRQYREGTRP